MRSMPSRRRALSTRVVYEAGTGGAKPAEVVETVVVAMAQYRCRKPKACDGDSAQNKRHSLRLRVGFYMEHAKVDVPLPTRCRPSVKRSSSIITVRGE